MINKIKEINKRSTNRISFSVNLINEFKLFEVAEIGVYRGEYAESILRQCKDIKSYTMIDPWRNLEDWNKPSNKVSSIFKEFFQETMQRTEFAKGKRKVIRGKTTEVIDKIEDNSFDFVYIDGDHTLKGITIDLINLWPKLKSTGFIVGDDFSPSIWQHNQVFEPTMVFPFAVYFAEAVNVKIYALPQYQFLISKLDTGFQFIDLTNGTYKHMDIRSQFYDRPSSPIKNYLKKKIPFVKNIYTALKNNKKF